MYIFGGGSANSTTFNDLWKFDLSRRKWVRPISVGSYPSPKACASMVCYQNQLIVFGGWRHPSEYPPHQQWRLFDELHVYNIKDNRWTMLMPNDGRPPPITGHSATIHRNVMVIFGGYQKVDNGTVNSNDIWCLNLTTFLWFKPEVSDVKKPPGRYGQFQIYIDENHFLILGGCGGPNNVFSDAWLLNMSENVWRWKSVAIKNKRWTASQMWCNPACRIGTKLVVVGPTASMPADCQYGRNHIVFNNRPLRQQPNNGEPLPLQQPEPHHRGENNVPDVHRRLAEADERNRQMIQRRENSLSPRVQRSNNLPNIAPAVNVDNDNRAAAAIPPPAIAGENSACQKGIDDLLERMRSLQRLRRNLQLGYREENGFWPQRFNEGSQERIRMAAFNVDNDNRIANRRDIRSARRIRMENFDREIRRRNNEERRDINRKLPDPVVVSAALPSTAHSSSSNSNDNQPIVKRIKRNCIALFVCDIENILMETDTSEPYLDWIEYKNYGIVPGAPERLIHSSLVAGNGELVLFGGLLKEQQTDSTSTLKVSNSIHFLSFPRNVF